MSGKKLNKNGKPKNVLPEEDVNVKLKTNNMSSLQQNVKSVQHKVEMHTLDLSQESKNVVLETLKHLHGSDFQLKHYSSYKDQGGNLSNQYWTNSGNLIVKGGIDYSAQTKRSMNAEDIVNMFALSKLENYGFHKNHCAEALQYNKGEVGLALELLLAKYMNLNLIFPVDKREMPSANEMEEIINEREGEKCVLESIYDTSFEEKIANRLWLITLDLDYLIEEFTEKRVQKTIRTKPAKEICKYYLKGHCKMGLRCKFAHDNPQPKLQQVIEKFTFQLEIRFPEGSRYPKEPCLPYLTTTAPKFPTEVCLRLNHFLLKHSFTSAENEEAAVYSLVQYLLEHTHDVLKTARDTSLTFLPPERSLFPKKVEIKVEVDDEPIYQLQPRKESKKQISEQEQRKEDTLLANKFKLKMNNKQYKSFLETRKKLPAWNYMECILNTIRENQVVVISGETGCGKSTQVPQFILDDWLVNGANEHVEIICTQPRRISAIGVAERVSEERVERIGQSVGYQIRLESKMSQATRLVFCTTGILLRRLEGDSELKGVSHIIVDEVHERSEESDFLLLIIKDMLEKRKDLKIVLMSATLNADLFSNYFGSVPIIEIPGRTFPVEQLFLEDIVEATKYILEENSPYARKVKMDYLETELESYDLKSISSETSPSLKDENLSLPQFGNRYKDYSKMTCKTMYMMDFTKINYELIEHIIVWIASGDHDYPNKGSILVFLPGMAEISQLHDQLCDNYILNPRGGKFLILPLHSTLSNEEQSLVFSKPKNGARKIVLSTNIAETSVTIDDCVFVIDSGRMKEKRFDPNKKMESLDTVWVSRANALQRKGRAGRVMPGVGVHLYTHNRFAHQILTQPVPELHRVPLEQLLLLIKTMDLFAHRDPHTVLASTLEPPPVESVDSAFERLKHVGALDQKHVLTPLGKHLAALPVDVRIGKLMLYGAIFCCVDAALTIAACLSYKSPFVSPFAKKELADKSRKEFSKGSSDHITVLTAYRKWLEINTQNKHAGKVFASENFLSWKTLVMLGDIKQQFLELLISIGFVCVDLPRHQAGTDRVLQITGKQLNSNGENNRLLASILCAALYPNVVKIMTPAKSFVASSGGAVPIGLKAEEIKFKTKEDGYVHIHPSSVNYTETKYMSPYMIYQEKVKTSRVFIRECTVVPVLPLVLFSSSNLNVELHNGTFVIALEDGWIRFSVQSHQIAELLQTIRVELVNILADKIRDPSLNLLKHDRGCKIISTIVHLVTRG